MNKNRLEAFSDGVIAIIITVMVLDLRVPHSSAFAGLGPLIPVFISYVLSYLFIAIYWNNHHHLLQAVQKVNGPILWANLHLLFWLSLVPFVTAWMGENNFASVPVASYGLVLFFAGLAFYLLSRCLVAFHGRSSLLAIAIGRDAKTLASLILYALAVALAFYMPKVSGCLYVLVATMWLIPDRRIERVLSSATPEYKQSRTDDFAVINGNGPQELKTFAGALSYAG